MGWMKNCNFLGDLNNFWYPWAKVGSSFGDKGSTYKTTHSHGTFFDPPPKKKVRV